MTTLAPTLEAFFTVRLLSQLRVSPRTIASYRDTMRMLLSYAHERSGRLPSQLDFTDINENVIEAFLTHLEHDRHNTVRTRNARLAAIHSLYRFAALRHPEHAQLIQRVMAIPTKRHDRALIDYLTDTETNALLTAANITTWLGRRDRALMLLTIQTGLRVSELTALTNIDIHLESGPYVRCWGKGRKERTTPLTKNTVKVLRSWMSEQSAPASAPLFPSRAGTVLSADAVQWLLNKYARLAAQRCPSLAAKRISPHVLRHTCAMNLLHANVNITLISLWLGHSDIRATQMYLHADLATKERTLAATAPLNTRPGRYKPPDALLAFLNAL